MARFPCLEHVGSMETADTVEKAMEHQRRRDGARLPRCRHDPEMIPAPLPVATLTRRRSSTSGR